MVNTNVFVGSVSARWITYDYSIDDVTPTYIVVNLASPLSLRSVAASPRTAIWKDENRRTHPGHRAYFEVSRAAVLATRRSPQIHAISGQLRCFLVFPRISRLHESCQ